jgi:hypothetical protein
MCANKSKTGLPKFTITIHIQAQTIAFREQLRYEVYNCLLKFKESTHYYDRKDIERFNIKFDTTTDADEVIQYVYQYMQDWICEMTKRYGVAPFHNIIAHKELSLLVPHASM